MGKPLIIVESPAKTRTIGQFLGKQYRLEASMGHVRDLPKSTLGVDVEDDFRPKYVPIRERAPVLKRLREAVAAADEVYLATDPDREGEAIAWHLVQALKIPEPRRIEFNEITRRAVTEALARPRPIDMQRVDAQQARRILDRLVGYKLSPLLQQKMRNRRLSAGRVQSVAVKLICDREREIQAFAPQEYWDLTAQVTPAGLNEAFPAKLVLKDGRKFTVESLEQAQAVAAELWEAPLRVARVKRSEQQRRPPAPFITSTLQQEAASRLGFSARQTMRVAQALYEGVELAGEHVGLITYMRTDSTRVAAEAQAEAREVIAAQFGEDYLPARPPQYGSARGAQEAHEAIRPTSPARTPDEVAGLLKDEAQVRLYRLIWSRFLASQMAPQRLDITAVDIEAGPYGLRSRGVRVLFPGFTVVYPTRDKEALLPAVKEGEWLDLVALEAVQKFTEPPPRYTEASLVRALEANGIGRPSTYAPIVSTIQERGYVYLEEKRFRPTELGFAVTDQLVQHFPDVISVEFTAEMEAKLDEIEEGKAERTGLLREFYRPFMKSLLEAESAMRPVASEAQETDEVCELCGKPMVLRMGRRGRFLACSGYPECRHTRPAPGSEEAARPAPEPTDEVCELCGKPMVVRTGRRGRFLACSGYPECRHTRPAPGSEEAARSAPEPTGEVCEQCGSPMVVRTGRRGRFLACSAYPKCRHTRALPEETEEAAVAGEICELCGRPMALRRSRYGPFLGCTGYPECKGTKRLPAKEKSETEEASAKG